MARHEQFSTQTALPVRVHRGKRAYFAGLSAEASVLRHYEARGYRLLAERWRGRRGEIDLIFDGGPEVVFVEVKASRNFDTAVAHVTAAQMRRLFQTAEEYVATCPDGTLTDLRLDVALVDQTGAVSVLPNAFAGYV